MWTQLTTFAIGFVSGLLSGAFGIGGGVITTPAIRLILGAPALVAVGTPLPVILPSALTGAYSYLKHDSADLRSGVVLGLSGSLTAVLGAWLTQFTGGRVVLLATAALVLYTAVDMVVQAYLPPGRDDTPAEKTGDRAPAADAARRARAATGRLIVIGAVTGLYAGFLGLGGGFILVPMLTRWLRFDIKLAIGTSLIAIGILAVPGTITHALLGHIDWAIALVLTLGVVPGALLGARLSLGSADRTIRLAFAGMLIVVGSWLAVSELGLLAWLR
jgi:uncharacterized membrane protein YfcA